MATVNTITANFDSMTPEQKKANLQALSYIKQLASSTNTQISRWDILASFGSGEGANLLTDKKAINKIFFAKLEKLVEKTAGDIALVDDLPELSSALENGFKVSIENQKRLIENEMRTINESIIASHRALDERIAKLVDTSKRLHFITKNTDPLGEIKKEINEVLRSGCWVNPVILGNQLYLNTKVNIILTFKNPAAGYDITQDFGQLSVRVDLDTFKMNVIPYKNNIHYPRYGESMGHYHPHVQYVGSICWGTGQETMVKLVKDFKIGKALELLYAVLTNYNDGNPYVHLSNFRDNGRKITADIIPLSLRHPEKLQEKEKEAVAVALTLPAVPEFHTGDAVEYERTTSENPRYDHLTDNGGHGEYVRTTVTGVTHTLITIALPSGGSWSWPNTGHEHYRPEQWARPGYLRHAR
jgi:hypothetical protein